MLKRLVGTTRLREIAERMVWEEYEMRLELRVPDRVLDFKRHRDPLRGESFYRAWDRESDKIVRLSEQEIPGFLRSGGDVGLLLDTDMCQTRYFICGRNEPFEKALEKSAVYLRDDQRGAYAFVSCGFVGDYEQFVISTITEDMLETLVRQCGGGMGEEYAVTRAVDRALPLSRLLLDSMSGHDKSSHSSGMHTHFMFDICGDDLTMWVAANLGNGASVPLATIRKRVGEDEISQENLGHHISFLVDEARRQYGFDMPKSLFVVCDENALVRQRIDPEEYRQGGLPLFRALFTDFFGREMSESARWILADDAPFRGLSLMERDGELAVGFAGGEGLR